MVTAVRATERRRTGEAGPTVDGTGPPREPASEGRLGGPAFPGSRGGAGNASGACGRDAAWAVAASVLDPEVPVLTIEDLGVLREVEVDDHGRVRVTITPTYSGCPAMDTIRADIVTAFAEAGVSDVEVRTVLSPAWTTDWMTEDGKRKLEQFGIAPPHPRRGDGVVPLTLSVRCPQCGSPDTRELSRFGSTACKALWACTACAEPFDHFKAI
jgi:ring-1,2-phenylacetyl-CoA epoxidase subunit PaaD